MAHWVDEVWKVSPLIMLAPRSILDWLVNRLNAALSWCPWRYLWRLDSVEQNDKILVSNSTVWRSTAVILSAGFMHPPIFHPPSAAPIVTDDCCACRAIFHQLTSVVFPLSTHYHIFASWRVLFHLLSLSSTLFRYPYSAPLFREHQLISTLYCAHAFVPYRLNTALHFPWLRTTSTYGWSNCHSPRFNPLQVCLFSAPVYFTTLFSWMISSLPFTYPFSTFWVLPNLLCPHSIPHSSHPP